MGAYASAQHTLDGGDGKLCGRSMQSDEKE